MDREHQEDEQKDGDHDSAHGSQNVGRPVRFGHFPAVRTNPTIRGSMIP
jgi:hypothetical protein